MLNFVAIKLLALGLSSVRSLILAAVLGPQSYGVLGTLLLLQQYLSYAALGMREGITVRLVQLRAGTGDRGPTVASALVWAAGVGVAVLALLVAMRPLARNLAPYLPWIGLIALLSMSNEILINVNRDRGKLRKVALLEVVYNSVPLTVALLEWHSLTIEHVLYALAAGLFLSVAIYLRTLRPLRLCEARRALIRELVTTGMPLAILSATALVVNSVYVLLANVMVPGRTLGLVVLANNLCTIVLFALNAIAWAATSRSMRSLYHGDDSHVEQRRSENLRALFRIGIAAAAMLCLAFEWLFRHVMTAYAGAGTYAFYFCLYQAYALLIFEEINRLSVTGRSLRVVAGYLCVLGVLAATHVAWPGAHLETLAIVGIVAYGVFAATVVRREVPYPDARAVRTKLLFVAMPTIAAGSHALAGPSGAVAACTAFAALAIACRRAKPAAAWRVSPWGADRGS